MKEELDDDDIKYVIPLHWATSYTNFLKNTSPYCETLDNRGLLKKIDEGVNLVEEEHYVVVNEIIWLILKSLYSGNPEITLKDVINPSRIPYVAAREVKL
jgi:hypothetical protein